MQLKNRAIVSHFPFRTDQGDRQGLIDYFLNSWELFEMLKSSIRKDAYFYHAPDPRRRPLIFYLGHTAAFYLNKLKAAGAITSGVDPRLDHLFAVGVDPAQSEDLDELNWPAVDQVWAYRQRVKEIVLEYLRTCKIPNQPQQNHPIWALLMGIEHERIHFETSSVLMRQYPTHFLQKPDGWEYASTAPIEARTEFVHLEGGPIEIGKPEQYPTFGWDNEYGKLPVEIHPFALSRTLITNKEFLEFVDDKGYQRPDLWGVKAWEWNEKFNISHPAFWIPDGAGGYRYRAQFDEMGLPPDWPAEVTANEALAYCRWKGEGYRLPTEAEFRFASCGQHPGADDDPAFSELHNLHLKFGSPHNVGSLPGSVSPDGITDLFGNVWDWLQDDFYPLPGFKQHPWYEDFSKPYFDQDHAMLLGGSWATCGTGASKWYRLWFRRNFVQHAGFRLAHTLS